MLLKVGKNNGGYAFFFSSLFEIFPRTVLIYISKRDYLARGKIFYNHRSIYQRSSLGNFTDSSRRSMY